MYTSLEISGGWWIWGSMLLKYKTKCKEFSNGVFIWNTKLKKKKKEREYSEHFILTCSTFYKAGQFNYKDTESVCSYILKAVFIKFWWS